MKNIGISVIWDELTERFKEADGISIKDVNRDARKYLTLFLEAGYDATIIAQMLDRFDVFKFYPVLKEHGVIMINFMELFSDASEFIEKNFDTFVNYGVPVDDVIKAIVAGGKVVEKEDLKSYIKKGATPRYILDLIAEDKDWFNYESIYEILLYLVKYGCEKSVITSWLMSSPFGTRDEVVYDIVEYDSKKWSEVLNPEQYVERWIERYGDQYIAGDYSLKTLPKLVNYDRVVEHFTMSEIILINASRGLYGFIDDYREVGGDPKKLVTRFVKEIGKPKNDIEKDALRAMEDQGLIVIPNDGSSQA